MHTPEALWSCGLLYNPETDGVKLAQLGWSFAHFQARLHTELFQSYVYVSSVVYNFGLERGQLSFHKCDLVLSPLGVSF